MISSPLIGKLTDKIGKDKMFCFGTFLTMLDVIGIYTNFVYNTFMDYNRYKYFPFSGIMSRIIPASALMTAIPAPQKV